MFLQPTDNLILNEKIDVKCDDCGKIEHKKIGLLKNARKRRVSTEDLCHSCVNKRSLHKRPQNSKKFWDEKRKDPNYTQAYLEGINNRSSIVGELNHMYGKSHTDQTKAKMSKARTGKTGEKATAWKGGKYSLNKRVKSALQRKYRWFHNVMDRDNCTCRHCGATKHLDAHHIKPISIIVKELLFDTKLILDTESSKMDWLIIQPNIIDKHLLNGLTLCRTCHRAVHANWGSHEPETQK